jgi:cytoskeletal protein CcmA (bactofilin family)
MWKKEDARPQEPEIPAAPPVPRSISTGHVSASPAPILSTRAAACISHGIKIKGEVTGSEDLFIDGQVDGKLNLANGSVTIGPNGVVIADISAREVIVRGRVEGKVTGRDKVQLWSTGQITGEVQTDRLAIEEGALLRGKVEAGKTTSKSADTQVAAAAAAVGKSPESAPLRSGVTAASGSAAD